jgi:hypothetical protein
MHCFLGDSIPQMQAYMFHRSLLLHKVIYLQLLLLLQDVSYALVLRWSIGLLQDHT